MAIEKVLVVGLGLMGRGILQVCAQGGFESYGYDVSEEAVKKATGHIEMSLEKRVKKGKLAEVHTGVRLLSSPGAALGVAAQHRQVRGLHPAILLAAKDFFVHA